jgi:hypothetical protein
MPPVTHGEVTDYYARHKQSFVVPERRTLEMTNRKSAAAVYALEREVEHGRSFASLASVQSVVRQHITPAAVIPAGRREAREKALLEKLIFSAKPGTLIGPVKLRVDYLAFEVIGIAAARLRSLRSAEASIESLLNAQRQRQALAAFAATWTRTWRPRTSCAPGFLAPRCRSSSTPPREDPFALEPPGGYFY